jgi:MHS family proline/betaine transporter-like MFS transporter
MTDLTAHAGALAPPPSMTRAIVAASIGNALEWFDVLVYGYFAVVLSGQFFPAGNPQLSLLLSLGTFGSSYLVRPLGAIVLGAYGDTAGRRAALSISIFVMMAGTLMMAVVPPYASIGVAAPLTVLAARLLQGFAVGGEFGSVTAYMVEHLPSRKGFLASFQWVGQGAAAVLASAFGVLLTGTLSEAQLDAWGWRIPFVFGLLIGPIGIYIRRGLTETPEFLATAPSKSPVADVVVRQSDRLLLAIALVAISTGVTYMLLYIPTYATKQLHLPPSTGFTATLIGGLILTFGAPLMGHWSDRLGRLRMLVVTTVLFLLSAYPAFLAITQVPTLAMLVAAVCWLSVLKTAYSGVLPAMMSTLFPTQTRATGMSLSYNIGVPLFGGFAPLIATWLIGVTGSNLAPSFYLIGMAAISLVAQVVVHRRLGLD